MWVDARYLPLFGRVLLACIFLMSGLNKIMNPQGTQQYMITMGMTWATTFFYLGAIAIEIGGGLSLLLGSWTRLGAWALALFMIPTTLIFHTNFGDPNQLIHFLKNLAITGGLLYIAAYGPGPISLDGRQIGPIDPMLDVGIRPLRGGARRTGT
jgi:putative oxidoreductase